MARTKIPATTSPVTQQPYAGMTKTKIPATTSAKNKQPAGYVSRQVAVRLGESSDSGAGPIKKRPESFRKEKKQRTAR
ncbi:unnamed protein product [Linum tenue]|uniref:Uncharacterized protein n=1 Tax=Linum tenue TaxID=586396 RepID=A0AAV0JRL7_9ROSI|nr:unnamed protein product [Linum tenue]